MESFFSEDKKHFLKRIRKVWIFCIGFGLWAILAFVGTVLAAEDPMATAGILKAKAILNAPEFMLTDLAGRKVSLRDYQGQVVLLSFWTTW